MRRYLKTLNISESIKTILEKERFSFIFACVCVMILPVYTWYLPPFMILWGLSRILEYLKNRNYNLRSDRYSTWLFILFIIFYSMQFAGLIYSDDKRTGLNILLSRLSLFLFPFVLVIPGGRVQRNIKLLLKIFAGSTAIYILCCFVYAFYRSVHIQNGNFVYNQHPPEAYWMSYFYGSYLAINQHPSYLAMYVILSVFIAFESWFDEKQRMVEHVVWIITAVFLLISIYFLSSRSGILAIVLLVPVYFFFKLKRKGKGLILAVTMVLILFILFPVIRSNERVGIVLNSISNKTFKQNAEKDGRFIIWQSALSVIKNNPVFGVGIGDVKSEMLKEYQKAGDKELIDKNYNAHNQFLEILLENGIIGLVFFCAVLGCIMVIAFIERNLLYGLFIAMMIIFFMFETVLYRLSGVSFFALFSFLLLHFKPVTAILESEKSNE
jgi:O-antigen ligase